MNFLSLFLNNLLALPILTFISGILFSLLRVKWFFTAKMHAVITFFLLFLIGLKGGSSLIEHSGHGLFSLLGLLVLWGFIQPLCAYLLLRRCTKVDALTAAAISACFGSVSVMTYIAGVTFLEKLGVPYQGLVIAALAIMEIPAIISGLFLSKIFTGSTHSSMKSLLMEAIFNKTVLIIFIGMLFGALSYLFQWRTLPLQLLTLFKPVLCIFLLNIGYLVGKHLKDLRTFSWSLLLFGLYMPLIGAAFGILLSYFLGLDPGTGTLITILSASASYIAVPAAMKIALPQAKEAIYVPLSLGITFPFNVVVGIPLYYQLATRFLS